MYCLVHCRHAQKVDPCHKLCCAHHQHEAKRETRYCCPDNCPNCGSCYQKCVTHEAQSKAQRADPSTHHHNWNRPPEYLPCCCFTGRVECPEYTSRCCLYNLSPIPACKHSKCDHLHLPCQYCQSQSSCRVRKQEAPPGLCASECQNEHFMRRSHGCNRNASSHDHANESRMPHLCCSTCCPCLNCLNKYRVIHNGKFYLHRCLHCVCCEFHQCGQHAKGGRWAPGPIVEALMGH